MSVYYIHPELTVGANKLAKDFFEFSYEELERYIDVTKLKTKDALFQVGFKKGDSLLFINRFDQEYELSIKNKITEAVEIGLDLYPVAIGKDSRIPLEPTSKSQSFDVVEELRKRSLTEANIETLGLSFARKIISRNQPTLTKEKVHIFISHKRKDGEEIAANVYYELRKRAESTFRDLIDISVGEEAQKIIEENLNKSDLIIFLDTPLAGDSKWIEIELKLALSLNIPIVWVKLGKSEDRISLEVKPSDKPHFVIEAFGDPDFKLDTKLIDDILEKAFEISRRSASLVFDKCSLIGSIAKSNGFNVELINKKQMVYKIEFPKQGNRYFERPRVHFFQCYSRLPNKNEKNQINPFLNDIGYNSHPNYGAFYDATILLSPTRKQDENLCEPCVVETYDEYIKYLTGETDTQLEKVNKRKGIIISGAFPDCEPEYQQELINAVHAITQAILLRKCTVIFGAHPTFQHLIFNVGKQLRRDGCKEFIEMYISRYFATDPLIEDYKVDAQIIATDSIENDRTKSLTVMRKEMINDEAAIALICIGGKTKAGGHTPGVDEEIKYAKEKGIPIYIIGSAGGRAAELASELNYGGWCDKINNLSALQNKKLMTSLDYGEMAGIIMESLI